MGNVLAISQKSSVEFFSDLHEAALEYIRQGFPIFPCLPNSKKPACENGFHDATTDLEQINAWWSENPNFNIGIEPERIGLCVVEVEADGLAQLTSFCNGHSALPPTFTNKSPRGGHHYFFDGSLQSLVRPFKGYNIDTRGRGGYVLLPPSRTADGEYVTINDGDVARLPGWIAQKIDQRKQDKREAVEGLIPDHPDNIRRAEKYLATREPPASGERNGTTYKIACKVRDLGCSQDKTLELVTKWAPISDDFTEEEVGIIVWSAFKSAQNAPGVDAVQPSSEAFKNLVANAPPQAERSQEIVFNYMIGTGDKSKPDPKRIENVAKLIEWMGFSLRRNVFTGLTEIGSLLGFEECTDAKMENIWAAGNSKGLRASYEDLVRNINVIANQSEYHPVREYLAGLVWDGKPRVDAWLSAYAGAESNRLNSEFGRVWLLGAVRRVLYPGCKFDYMLVLEGPQGAKKSSLFERLAGGSPWFTDSIKLGSDPKITIEQTRGVWIAECAELKGMRANEIEAVKAQITTQFDRARLAYSRHPVTVPRQFIMGGTTNDSQYLRDQTGNRRFLPVKVGAIDLEALGKDRDQIWAEAYARVKTGELAILAEGVLKDASEVQAARALPDAIKERLGELLDGLQGWVAKEDLWTVLGRPDAAARKQTEQNALADAMREMGWVLSRQRRGGKLLYCFTKGTANEWLNLVGGRNPHFDYDAI